MRPFVRFRLPALALLAGLLPCAAAQGPPGAIVVTDTAARRDVAPHALYPATVISRNDARLAGEIDGRLTWVAEVGDRISEGEDIAKLDDTLISQQVVEEESNIQREQARRDFHTRQLKRLQELLAQNSISRSRVDQEETDLAVARNNIRSAQARLAQAEEQLRRTRVRAPFDGVVSERLLQAGEWAKSGDAVVRLVSTDDLELEAHVPAGSLPLVRVGSTLPWVDGKNKGEGEVRTIVPVGGDVSRMYELRISISDAALNAGKLLQVAVPTAAARSAVMVSRDALVLRREGVYVFRVNAQGMAERVQVETGIAEGAYIEVTGGITAGDRVVTRGGENLRPGMPVTENPPTGS